ncbi:hypothetical protein QQX98_000938 [Neonectria punicea]|uniref:BZIP domain-containing protein n=1 Tax=Neonectria punicea TaxID=979145 RepID=A0ABR1HR93_9HYPO
MNDGQHDQSSPDAAALAEAERRRQFHETCLTMNQAINRSKREKRAARAIREKQKERERAKKMPLIPGRQPEVLHVGRYQTQPFDIAFPQHHAAPPLASTQQYAAPPLAFPLVSAIAPAMVFTRQCAAPLQDLPFASTTQCAAPGYIQQPAPKYWAAQNPEYAAPSYAAPTHMPPVYDTGYMSFVDAPLPQNSQPQFSLNSALFPPAVPAYAADQSQFSNGNVFPAPAQLESQGIGYWDDMNMDMAFNHMPNFMPDDAPPVYDEGLEYLEVPEMDNADGHHINGHNDTSTGFM